MAALDTFADLMQALDENPKLGEVLAARILPPELLGLPPQVAELVVAMNQHAQANRKQFAAQDRRAAANTQQISDLDQKVEVYQQANTRQINTLDQKVEAYQQANRELIADQDRRREERDQASERRFRRIENDLSYLKGSHARYAALEDAAVIAEEMGLEYIRSLTRLELYRMVQNADTTGIPSNALNSFRHADLVMEAVNPAGETCYIAVEISFTADERDTNRAIRNAGFLTRFTGREAHSAVAGVYQDNDIQPQIAAGAVFWHHLLREDMEAE